MNEHPLISHSGFSGTDMIVLNSILNIIGKSRSDIQITPNMEKADIVFVDGDQPDADSLVDTVLERTSKTVVKVAKNISGRRSDSRCVVMQKPMTLRRANEALNYIFSAYKLNGLLATTEMASNANILIVDDSFPVRNYMEKKIKELSKGKFTSLSADSGKEAIELLKKNQFDLVFLDVIMPGIDGYKVCKWIKTTFPTTKVVMLSGKKSAFDKVRGSISGCDAYITKPPEDSKILAVLNAI